MREIEEDLQLSLREVDRAQPPEDSSAKLNLLDKQGFFYELFQGLYEQQQRELVHKFIDLAKIDEAKRQFERDPSCLRYHDHSGFTPLHRCAISDYVDLARFFLTYALRVQSQQHDEPPLMDVNAVDNRRWTALHWGP